MPRNAAGTYSLPNSPVVTGTTIDSADENDTRDDLASEMTNSLDRGGRGAMTAALKIVDGTAAFPGIQFSSDANNGFFRNGADDWSASAGSTEVANFTTTGVKVFGFKLNTLSPAQITANQNDYNPTSLSSASYLRLDTDAARDLTGLQGGVAGRCIRIHYVGSTSITLKDESASSTAAYRFALPADLVLGPDMSVDLTYDATTSRWRMQTGAVSAALQPVVNASTLAAARTTLDVPSNSEAILDSIIDAKGDLIYGAAADTPAVLANGIEMIGAAPGGRLTLTSGTPVTTGDVTGATTVYYTPHQGNIVSLYDGDTWIPYIFSELSQATSDTTKSPAAVANNSNYDIFVWNDSGTLRATRGPLWTSDTARGTGAGTTELELFEGRYVNKVAITNGPAAQRGLYVGTIRSDGSAQINDSAAKRHVWNMFNRVQRSMRNATETTDTWTYTTATLRQANANAANQLDYVAGLAEDAVSAFCLCNASNSSGIVGANVGIGVDSTSVNSATISGGVNIRSDQQLEVNAFYSGIPGIGRHYLAWLEYSQATGTTTWRGDGGTTGLEQAGIYGEVLA